MTFRVWTADLAPIVRRLVIVGGSLGAARVAEEARRLGYAGAITIVSGEPDEPYDRSSLSRAFLTAAVEPSPEPLLDAGRLGVTLMLGTTAFSLDCRNRRVRTDKGDIGYDALVIAVGTRPRRLDPVRQLPGVIAFQTVEDARRVWAALCPGARIVVIGAGFVGGEITSAARAAGADVTLIEARPHPLVSAVGPVVAERLARLHERYGVTVLSHRRVREFIGVRHVEKVRLDDGSVVPADIVIGDIGGEPDTGWLRGSGVAVSDGVACSPYLESTVPGIYAVGDAARWVNQWNGRSTRLEHWAAVGDQAAAVTRNALTTGRVPFGVIPYVRSAWYGYPLQLLGEPADEVELLDTPDADGPFHARYRYDGQLVGAFACGQTGLLMTLRGTMEQQAVRQSTGHPGAVKLMSVD
jgi:NADPH-dependent 2,4-dienoyl-CoA reductase/sulfur reductase-like enzyme